MMKLLIQLTSRLSETVEAWEEFRGNEIGYFSDNESFTLKPSVAAVSKTFAQLSVLLIRLERLKIELCNNNPQGVSCLPYFRYKSELHASIGEVPMLIRQLHAHLSLENSEAAIAQRRTASHVEILTVITIVSLLVKSKVR